MQDRRLADAASEALARGWSAADLVHAVRWSSPKGARLLARVVVTGDDGADRVAPAPYVEPWRLGEGLDERAAVSQVAVVVLLLGAQQPIPRTRRATGARPTTDVLSRVRALLAKAEATNYPAEAEAFTAKAQELMSRHAIDEAMLAASSRLDGEARGMSVGRVHFDDPYLAQKADLLHVIARANGSRAVTHGNLGMATIVGAEHDLEMVELLFTSLLLQATVAMQEAGRVGAEHRTRRFRTSFLTSFARRIGERLDEAARSAVDEGRVTYGSALVPALALKEQQVLETVHELFPNLRTRRGSLTIDSRGWAAGREAADRADVGRQRRIAS